MDSIQEFINRVVDNVECTLDLLPNDVTGVSVFNQASGKFEFRPGPVFVNILLADEINRVSLARRYWDRIRRALRKPGPS